MELKENFLQESIPVKCQIINELVEKHIKNNTVSAIPEQLTYYVENSDNNEKYAFKGPETGGRKLSILILVLLLLAFVVILIISVCVLVFSTNYRLYGLVGLGASLFAIILNFALVIKSSHTVRFIKRYNRYYTYLEYRNSALIADLCNIFKVKKETVIKDLREVLDYRFIPQGQLVSDDRLLLFSAHMVTRYQKNKAKNDENITRVLANTTDSEASYLSAIYLVIDENLALLTKLMKEKRSSGISRELEKMKSLLYGLKYTFDLAPDDAASMESFVENYCTSMEKLITSYMQFASHTKENKSINVHRGALRIVNRAYIAILHEYYSENSILEK